MPTDELANAQNPVEAVDQLATDRAVGLDALAKEFELIETAVAAPAAHEPDLVSESVKSLEGSLSSLIKQIRSDPRVPEVGVHSTKAFLNAFKQISDDVSRLAEDHVRRAQDLKADADSLAAEVMRCGHLFCRRLEDQAVRGYQTDRVLREARALIAQS